MITVYVGGPIDRADKEEASSWREKLRVLAAERSTQMMLFDPFASFQVTDGDELSKRAMATISKTNRSFLEQTDYALFYMAGEAPAFGTIREIEYCQTQQVRCVVVANEQLTLHVEAWDLVTVPTLANALDIIETWEEEQEDQYPFDPTEFQEVKISPLPCQEHAQQPSTDNQQSIINTLAAVLSQPCHAHVVNGEHRRLMVVDTISVARVLHKLDTREWKVIGGKFDDGYRFIELIEQR